MKTMLGSFYARPLAAYLIVALIVMSSFAASAEAMARVNRLSDQQLHELAARTDSVQAGGDGVDLLFGLVIVALLVVVLVYLLQGRIEVK